MFNVVISFANHVDFSMQVQLPLQYTLCGNLCYYGYTTNTDGSVFWRASAKPPKMGQSVIEKAIDRTFVVITEWPARSAEQRSVVAADMHEALRIVQSDPSARLASGISVREQTASDASTRHG